MALRLMKSLPTMVVLLVTMVAMLVMEPHLAVATPGFLGRDGYGPGRRNSEEHSYRTSNSTGHGGIHVGGSMHIGRINKGRIYYRGHNSSSTNTRPGSKPVLSNPSRNKGAKGGRITNIRQQRNRRYRSTHGGNRKEAGNGTHIPVRGNIPFGNNRTNDDHQGPYIHPGLVHNHPTIRPGKGGQTHVGVHNGGRYRNNRAGNRKGNSSHTSVGRNGGRNKTRGNGAHQNPIRGNGGGSRGSHTGDKLPGVGNGSDKGGSNPGDNNQGSHTGDKPPGVSNGSDKGGSNPGDNNQGSHTGDKPPGVSNGSDKGGSNPGDNNQGSHTGDKPPGVSNGSDKGGSNPGDNNQGSHTGDKPPGVSNGSDKGGSNPGDNNQGNHSGNNSSHVGQSGNGSANNATGPDCKKKGGICGDPKVVGGDGVVFYFYGRKSHDYCLVSDTDLHINAHFIGTRPPGHTRDNTWVQALGFVFGTHTLTIAAKRNVSHWHSQEDHLQISYNNAPLNLTTMWKSPDQAITMTRIGHANSVTMAIKGKLEVSLAVIPISKKTNVVHKYDIPEDVDCFAHFDMQFTFYNLSGAVDGVLGQTYQPGFVNPVNQSVAMPIMGGAARFESSSLLATDCKSSQYTASAAPVNSGRANFHTICRSSGLFSGVSGGITCHR